MAGSRDPLALGRSAASETVRYSGQGTYLPPNARRYHSNEHCWTSKVSASLREVQRDCRAFPIGLTSGTRPTY